MKRLIALIAALALSVAVANAQTARSEFNNSHPSIGGKS